MSARNAQIADALQQLLQTGNTTSPETKRQPPASIARANAHVHSSFDPYAQRNSELELWRLSDFKWLAASQGMLVDVRRLTRDRAYAADCLARAMRSSCEPLRDCSRLLCPLLCPVLPG